MLLRIRDFTRATTVLLFTGIVSMEELHLKYWYT